MTDHQNGSWRGWLLVVLSVAMGGVIVFLGQMVLSNEHRITITEENIKDQGEAIRQFKSDVTEQLRQINVKLDRLVERGK